MLVTRGGFTIGAHEFTRHHPTIELVSGTDLDVLLKEHLGTRWVERLVEQSLRGKGGKIPDAIRIQADQSSVLSQVIS